MSIEKTPLILVRQTYSYEDRLGCNGCNSPIAAHVLEVGSSYGGKGTSASLYRMCEACFRLLKVAVLDYASQATALCRCPCYNCIAADHVVTP